VIDAVAKRRHVGSRDAQVELNKAAPQTVVNNQ
jgi:hypothetical protein